MPSNSPPPTCRTQRSLSMASESQRIRDALINSTSNSPQSHVPVSPSSSSLSSKYDTPKKHLSHDTPRSLFGDYDHLPSPPLPPLPDPPTLTPEQINKIHRQKEPTLQQKESKKLERQAKLEQKQKKAEYQRMYQNQHDYIRSIDRKAEKPQQLSLPIYPAGRQQCDTLPTAEVYYHEIRHQPKTASNYSQHHNSFSSSNSTMTSSSQIKPSLDKTRSMSLKSTTKSMYDLRPWSGTPQSPTFDYTLYDNDDTGTRGWDSLMDTLYSPSTDSPSWSNSSLNDPYVASSGSKDLDPDLGQLVDTALSSLALSTDKLGNGNGKYLLGKLSNQKCTTTTTRRRRRRKFTLYVHPPPPSLSFLCVCVCEYLRSFMFIQSMLLCCGQHNSPCIGHH